MDIREAIDKAGPGGKIKKASWKGGYYRIGDDVGYLWTHHDEVWHKVVLTANDLTATDWTVIPEERIEVGDVVEKDPCVSSRSGCHVLAIERIGSCVIYALHQRERACACVAQPDNRLTLIHKGSKKQGQRCASAPVCAGYVDEESRGWQ